MFQFFLYTFFYFYYSRHLFLKSDFLCVFFFSLSLVLHKSFIFVAIRIKLFISYQFKFYKLYLLLENEDEWAWVGDFLFLVSILWFCSCFPFFSFLNLHKNLHFLKNKNEALSLSYYYMGENGWHVSHHFIYNYVLKFPWKFLFFEAIN